MQEEEEEEEEGWRRREGENRVVGEGQYAPCVVQDNVHSRTLQCVHFGPDSISVVAQNVRSELLEVGN
jgi:hypothetical protein